MCGIIGYVGSRNAQDILLGGLKRMEYRGYDSAGIVTFSQSHEVTLLKAKGRVAELAEKIRKNDRLDTIGIGHTRWATHGEPSETNAHPHQVGDIYLAHNGIIENYQELKEQLPDHTFTSETDTEVLTALIELLYRREDVKLENAVTQALKLVKGTYGIAVLSQREPGKIVAARLGSPLIVGVGKRETIIVSDAAALLGHTENAIYLKDGELAVCTADQVEVIDLDAQPVSAIVETIETDLAAIEKGGYEHFLLKEIMEQPKSLQSTLSGRVRKADDIVRLGGIRMNSDELREIKHIIIVACGTAAYAGMMAGYYAEQLTDDVTIRVEVASELRYRSINIPEHTVALFVSQSGETADTLACLKELKRRGVRCLGFVNTVGSSIAREVDGGVYLHAGPEISVASTKAFTSQVAALIIFMLSMAEAKGLDMQTLRSYIDELDALPREIEKVLTHNQDEIKAAALKYKDYQHAFYLGRDVQFPTALEGALKLKETSYVHVEGQPAGELKHGSIALIDDSFFEMVFLDDERLFEKTMSNVIEVQSRGGHVIVVTNSKRDIQAETVIALPTRLKLLTPLVYNVVSQLFAYNVAVSRGNDVDKPRNLAKSVTVE
ncbi:glutamine--fructose-6-phosphate transaminase (isomerizing) [Candidatus Saccharibacteria bacterium]|nr:glutamine--fructose-6-phosphate transaminase (isomerizing) [Candidatus Saccharibacteria bacterium]